MQNHGPQNNFESDQSQASHRKLNHLDLSKEAQGLVLGHDQRFNYEPLLSAHPNSLENLTTSFLGKKLKAPLWISSMTGGTDEAFFINQNLAKAAKTFGLGFGLGSCRSLLQGDKYLSHFDWRDIMGDELPLLANLGIAQVEEMVKQQDLRPLENLMKKLRADGLVVHINPLQEWLQPEGDRLTLAPYQCLKFLKENFSYPLMVKEVGQGMGPMSLKALLELDIAAIELAAFGGTNFSQIEILRQKQKDLGLQALGHVGHSASEMIKIIKQEVTAIQEQNPAYRPPEIVISGGLRSFLDVHYFRKKLGFSSLGGFAQALLQRARISYDELDSFLRVQIEALALAECYLTLRQDSRGD